MKPKEERGGTPEIHAASLKYNLRIIEYTVEEAGSNTIQTATHGSGVHAVHLCARMGRVYDALLMSQDAPRTQAEVDKMETRRVMRDARNTNQAIPRPKPTIPVAPHETRLSSLNALQAVTNLKLSPATLRERMIEAHKDLQNPQGLQWHRNQQIGGYTSKAVLQLLTHMGYDTRHVTLKLSDTTRQHTLSMLLDNTCLESDAAIIIVDGSHLYYTIINLLIP